jgi:energy-coupling factor transporter transmembrane protein EcfT
MNEAEEKAKAKKIKVLQFIIYALGLFIFSLIIFGFYRMIYEPEKPYWPFLITGFVLNTLVLGVLPPIARKFFFKGD